MFRKPYDVEVKVRRFPFDDLKEAEELLSKIGYFPKQPREPGWVEILNSSKNGKYHVSHMGRLCHGEVYIYNLETGNIAGRLHPGEILAEEDELKRALEGKLKDTRLF